MLLIREVRINCEWPDWLKILTDEDEFPLEEHGGQYVEDGRFVKMVKENPQIDIFESVVKHPLQFHYFAIKRELDETARWRKLLRVQIIEQNRTLGFWCAVPRCYQIHQLQVPN